MARPRTIKQGSPVPAAAKAPVRRKAVAPKATAPVEAVVPVLATPQIEVPAIETPILQVAIAQATTEIPAPVAELPAAAEPEIEPAPVAQTIEPTITELKEQIMAIKTPEFAADMTATVADAVNEMQARLATAMEKGTSTLTEMTDLAKGNVEAVVESGKVLASGLQGLGKTYAEEAKSAYETATADFKEMAAIKSPTELFQLQGKIMRRNFDLFVAAATKGTDAAVKLANDTVAPISGRVTVATETLAKVA